MGSNPSIERTSSGKRPPLMSNVRGHPSGTSSLRRLEIEILQLEGMPPAVFGETIVVAVGIHTSGPYFKGKYHILTQRASPPLQSGTWRFEQVLAPESLATVDLQFMLEHSVGYAESVLVDRLIARAAELKAERLLGERISLKRNVASPFVRMRLFGQFEAEVPELARRTECQGLHRYLSALSQVQPIEWVPKR